LLQDVKGFFQGVTERNFKYPMRVAAAVEYMADLNDAFAAGKPCQFPPVATAVPFSADETYTYEAPPPKDEE
jgi:hypothetical protein